MRNQPPKSRTKQELYAAALRALTRRAHSIHEMKKYLARQAENNEEIAPVIAELREQGYLDDAKFAIGYARQHAESRRQGRFRIQRELRARGVPDQHIDAALETVFAETDEHAQARRLIKRQLARVRGPIDQRELARVYRSLLRAGFPAEVIRTELRTVKRAGNESDDIPEDESGFETVDDRR